MDIETKLTARLVKAWREMSCEVLNIIGNNFQAPGWPDVFVCGKLWTGWIEFKGPETELQPHQARVIKALGKTESVYIVRFAYQLRQAWCFEISDANLNIVSEKDIIGTDGQVAAGLLKELARLDN